METSECGRHCPCSSNLTCTVHTQSFVSCVAAADETVMLSAECAVDNITTMYNVACNGAQ